MSPTSRRCAAAHVVRIEPLESRQLLAVALDLNFGVEGRVSSDLKVDGPPDQDFVTDALLRDDGKLLVLASNDTDFFVVRYNPDGARDESFAPEGRVVLPRAGRTYYRRLHLLPDGKMLVGGLKLLSNSTNEILVQLRADGSLDTSFGNAGIVIPPTGGDADVSEFASAVLPNGKILVSGQINSVVGYDDAVISRFNSDGTIDTTFGQNGVYRYNLADHIETFIDNLIVNADGSFYGATTVGQARFDANGNLDTTFGGSGLISGLAFKLRQPDGKFLSYSRREGTPQNYNVAVHRWNADGSQDTGFGVDGTTAIDFARNDTPRHLALDFSGRIILGAYIQHGTHPDTYAGNALARLLPDGTPDPAFAPDGIYVDASAGSGDMRVVLPSADGKITVVGNTGFPSTEFPDPGFSYTNVGITRYVPDVAITISAGPFGPVIEGQNFQVNDNGSIYANGQIIKYEWDYGSSGRNFNTDGIGATTQLQAGDSPSSLVALRVTTSDGLSAIGVTSVSILNAPPTADAGPDRVGAAGVQMKLHFASDDAALEEGRWIVDYGDGTPNTSIDIWFGGPNRGPEVTFLTHTYAQNGVYTVTFTVEDGDGGSSTDHTTVVIGDIVARVFEDTDGNGVQLSSTELGAPGRTVWMDSNDNGILDNGELSGISDTFGDVMFSGIAAGVYSIRTAVADGWQVTFADAAQRGDSCSANTTSSPGAACVFGLTQRAMVTGIFFHDRNSNGVRDPGEPPVGNRTARATDLSGVLKGSGGSFVSDGFYRIRGLLPGDYRIAFNETNDWLQTFPTGNGSYQVTLAAGQTVANIDFGVVQTATVRGIVFEDLNADGIYNSPDRLYTTNNHIWPENIFIDLDNDAVRDADERVIASRGDGTWTMDWVPPGTRTFRLLPRPGWVETTQGVIVEIAPGAIVSDVRLGTQKTDFIVPQVSSFVFRHDLKPHVIELIFSEPVDITPDDLTVAGGSIAFNLTSYEPAQNKAIFTRSGSGLLADGNYLAVVKDYVDMAGNVPGSESSWPFFVLSGDLNRDRTVSIADFLTVSANFNKTNASYADGDLNYDGTVSIADFLQVAGNFNQVLEAPQPAQAAASVEILSSEDSISGDLLEVNADKKNPKKRASRELLTRQKRTHHRRRGLLRRVA
jgi:uncharacterized delta-60 repeat protein